MTATPATATPALALANTVLAGLTLAFGGLSQVPDRLVGEAVYAHFANGGGQDTHPHAVMAAAAALIAARWEEDGEAILARVEVGFADACDE